MKREKCKRRRTRGIIDATGYIKMRGSRDE
jgi:hypothetical protein